MITGAPTLDAAEPLVTVQHYDGPPQSRAADLITRARLADEEMSFTPAARPASDAVDGSVITTIEIFTTLHRWSAPIASEPQLAGVMTAQTDSDTTVLDIVVAPEFRSTGVATAAIEYLLTAGASELAAATGAVVACAYGSHPAALRLAARFGADVRGEVHHLLLPSATAYRESRLAHTAHAGSAESVDVALNDGVGLLGPLPVGPSRSATLRATVVALFDDGAESIEAVADGTDAALIDLLRSAAFGHDRTDVYLHRSFA